MSSLEVCNELVPQIHLTGAWPSMRTQCMSIFISPGSMSCTFIVSLVAWAVFRDVLLFVSLVFMNCLTCGFLWILWRSAYFVSKLSKSVSLCCDCGAILLVSVFSLWCFPVVMFWIECFSVSSCSKKTCPRMSETCLRNVSRGVSETLQVFRHILASQDCKRTCPFSGDNPGCKTLLI